MPANARNMCHDCRREKKKLFLKGEKCFGPKCPIEKRNNQAPGQHGQKGGRPTDYGRMLREKQALKNTYCVLEKQFKKHYSEAERRKGPTGQNLLQILETRLDNVVYRMGYSASRPEARQLVSHKTILVNGKLVNIPSYEVKVGDVVSVVENKKEQLRIKTAIKSAHERGLPEWVEVDMSTLSAKFKVLPERSDLPADIQEHLVVELYSK